MIHNSRLPTAFVTAADTFFSAHLISALLEKKLRIFAAPSLISPQPELLQPFSRHSRLTLLDSPGSLTSPDCPSPSYLFLTSWLQVPFSSAISSQQISSLLQADLALFSCLSTRSLRVVLLLPYSLFPDSQLGQCRSAINTFVDLVFQPTKSRQASTSVVYLQDLYGPGINLAAPAPLAQIFRLLSHPSPLSLPAAAEIRLQPLFITDAVTAVLKVAFSSKSPSVFHFAGPQAITPLSLAHLLAGLSGQKFSVHPRPFPQLHLSHRPRSGLAFLPVSQSPSAGRFIPNPLSNSFQGNFTSSSPSWWRPKVPLRSGLRQILNWINPELSPSPSSQMSTQTSKALPVPAPPLIKQPPRFSFHRLFSPPASVTRLRLLWSSLLAFLPPRRLSLRLAPSLVLTFSAVSLLGFSLVAHQALAHLKASYSHLAQGNFSQAIQSSQKSTRYLQRLDLPLRLANPFFRFFFPHQPPLSYLASAHQAATSLRQLAVSGSQLQQLFVQVAVSSPEDPPLSPLPSALAQIRQAHSSLALLQATLPSTGPPFFNQARWEQFPLQLAVARQYLSLSQNLLDLLPRLVGLDRPQTYLVLLQNNRELRPTGGFIGSFILVTFSQGQLVDLQVHDVYSADGQLKGHVQPPAPIKTYLGEANWFLRDANWDPDFPSSANKIAWFLDKELDRQIDGVLAMDVTFLESILKITGPLYLPDYQETITADNLYLRTQQRVEADFFPGSHAKRNFLAALVTALTEKLQTTNHLPWPSLFQAAAAGLDQKHLLLSFFDSQVARYFALLGWDGGLPAPHGFSEVSPVVDPLAQAKMASGSQVLGVDTLLQDELFLVEANLGVNKANGFITRQLTHTVDLTSKGGVGETLTIFYKNYSQTNSWPGGSYKNYLRIYLPLDSQVASVIVEDPLERQAQLITPLELDASVEHQRQVFGFFFTVPSQSQRLLRISYRLPAKVSAKIGLPPGTPGMTRGDSLGVEAADAPLPPGEFSYRLRLLKQPGTLADPYQLTIIYPDYLIPTSSSPQLLTTTGKLTYNTTLSTDKSILVNFVFK